MSKTVLFPTDFSEVSLKVLDTFVELKVMGVDKVILFHVVDERGFQVVETYTSLKEIEKKSMDRAHAELEKIAQKLRDQGFTVIPKIEVGIPVREILKIEKDDEVSLIVLGSHGRSNLADIFIGSVAEKVIRKCTKSVFVVKR